MVVRQLVASLPACFAVSAPGRAGARTAALLLLAAAVGPSAPSPATADTLYRFVDERGVVHYSNVPSDPRYERVRRYSPGRSHPRVWTPRKTRVFDPLIARTASRHGLPAGLVKAVIAAESNFDPKARSPKGAQGLMQLMPATAAHLGVRDPYHPEQNVRGGTRYLAGLLARYGDWTRALAAYNAGPKAVDRYRGVPPYPETRQYVERVLTYYRRYDAEFAR